MSRTRALQASDFPSLSHRALSPNDLIGSVSFLRLPCREYQSTNLSITHRVNLIIEINEKEEEPKKRPGIRKTALDFEKPVHPSFS